jgi:hypothetical protein
MRMQSSRGRSRNCAPPPRSMPASPCRSGSSRNRDGPAGRPGLSGLPGRSIPIQRAGIVERQVAAIEDRAQTSGPAAEPIEQLEDCEQLAMLEQSELALGHLDERLASVRLQYRTAAALLSDARRAASKRLAAAVTSLMRQLGMPGGRFEIAMESNADSDPAADGVVD